MTDLYRNNELRNAICDWLRANDINPNDVPIDSHVAIQNEQIIYERYVRDASGRLVLHGDHPPRETRTASLICAPTGAVADWVWWPA